MDAITYLLLAADAPPQPAERIGIAGQFFTLYGAPTTLIQCSEFSLYKRFLDGENIRPILDERRAIGFNARRVWLLNTSVIPGGLHPAHYPRFYDRLPEFLELCGDVTELTAFTQTQTLMPTLDEQRAHWENVQMAVRDCPNVLLELVNEADQHDNRTDAALLNMRPAGILASSGSNGADSPPPMPVWDYALYHSNGLNEWQRKVGHNTMEWADTYRVPAMANENTRYPDQDDSEAHAYDAAAGAALLCAGSCYHSQAGKLSVAFSAGEARCAEAWVSGARSVPLEFQRGRYIHRTDLEGPDVLRAYERRLSDGRGHVVRIRP